MILVFAKSLAWASLGAQLVASLGVSLGAVEFEMLGAR